MAKVYLVSEGSYSDYHICGVFSTEEKARAAMELLADGDMEEFELDPVSPHPPGMKYWSVQMHADGNVASLRQDSVSIDSPVNNREAPYGKEAYWYFGVWARDREHAVKIANERRIQMLASGEWNTTWEEWVKKRSTK
jgi:hypothetical protein